MEDKSPLPLSGVRILDLSHVIAGPFCAAILSDLGAEVIKIEPPGRGDRARGTTPVIKSDGESVSGFFATVARNRKGLALNLKTDEGKDAFRELVSTSDVLVENFSPHTMDRLGLGYADLRLINPRLIWVSITGFGQLEPYVGPYSRWQANNATAQAMSGLMHESGDMDGPPAFVGFAMGDTVPGLWAALGTLVALHHRGQTGEGQFVDTAMYDSLVGMSVNSLAEYHVSRNAPSRGSLGWPNTFSTRLRCSDGYIAVSMWGTDPQKWTALWKKIGREDMLTNEDFDSSMPGRPETFQLVRDVLEGWLVAITRREAVQTLLDLGFSAGMVQNAAETYACPQLAARELFLEVDHGLGGTMRNVGVPIKFSGFRYRAPSRAPRLGEHTEDILKGLLGYSDEKISRLRSQGAIPSPTQNSG